MTMKIVKSIFLICILSISAALAAGPEESASLRGPDTEPELGTIHYRRHNIFYGCANDECCKHETFDACGFE